jgi:uncharacterized membrane protein
MSWDPYFIATHWFAGLLLAIAVLFGVWLLLRRQRTGNWSVPLGSAAGTAGLLAFGGVLLPPDVGIWVVVGAAAVLAGMIVVLVITGRWSGPLAIAVGGVAALGLGGLVVVPITDGLREAVVLARSVEFLQPWWLLLLVLIPIIILYSRRSLAGLGPIRSWVALGLRCALILFLTLALAEARLRHQSEYSTVIFLLDRSLSVPTEPDDSRPGVTVDRRWERIKKFINDAVELRGGQHDHDQAGLIAFGKRPRLELPPASVPRFNFNEVVGTIDGNYTDIGAAIKLALASFPENTGKRIVLISDGNENLGSAEEQARYAKQNGVEIDVVPLAAGQRNENEVLVHSVEAPSVVEQGARLPIRVQVRSFNPNLVVGTLTVKQISEGQSMDVPGSPRKNVTLSPGLNSFTFKQPLSAEQRSYTYEADFLPEFVVDETGKVLSRGLPGDRPQNNRATTHVVAHGQRRILLIEPKNGQHEHLLEQLRQAGKSKFDVDTIEVDKLPPEKDKMTVLLSNYDCVILANVPASDVAEGQVGDNVSGAISEVQQEVLRSNTHDQGCGLIMIGGPNGFGAGGWRGTPVEKALPVDCDIKSAEVGGKGGLVLIMHASEIAEGNRWQKVIAKLAINKLSSSDMVGVLHYAYVGAAGHQWHLPFQEVGEGPNRNRLMNIVESLAPGDMPDVDPALEKAFAALTKPEYDLVTRHIIFISDGDHWNASPAVLAKLRNNKITCTTVCITSHGQQEEQKMAAVAQATRGRFYSVKNPSNLPAIYTNETRIVSQSLIYERKFQPRRVFASGPTDKLPEQLQPLYGFVRTTAKPSQLVEVPIMSPPLTGGMEFPILAYWHYGLGKSAAFTSDARTQPGKLFWDRDWASSDMYSKFWEQLLEWTLRPVESRRLTMSTEHRDGTVTVVVDARDDKGHPVVDLKLRGGVTTPAGKVDDPRLQELTFEQKNSGQYVAQFKAEEAGSYFVSAQAVRTKPVKDKDGNIKGEVEEGFDSTRAGVTIPYSPEFADLESNTALLEKLRSMTGGQTYADDTDTLTAVAKNGDVFRPGLPSFYSLQPIWYWLLTIAAVLLLLDVAVRRIAVDPLHVMVVLQGHWDRLRGLTATRERVPEFFDRLRSRKAQVGETLQRDRAARRFEGEPSAAPAPAGAMDVPDTPPPIARAAPQRTSLAPQTQREEPADYASRLLKAKKRVWQDRDKDKEQ